VTARWVVDEVRPHRDLEITWQPISLFLKNEPDPDGDAYPRYFFTHRLLRVMEAVRETDGNDGVERIYWEYGRRIHHDRERPFDPVHALRAADLDPGLATAADDEQFDAEIRSRMQLGLELAGDDIGTPIIAGADCYGNRQGYFGPVITRVPPTEDSLKMWDALRAMMDVQGFWELKRTRTERPEFGDRP
jgi:hypothetical protein